MTGSVETKAVSHDEMSSNSGALAAFNAMSRDAR
jgi:hypothetical protein